MEISDYIGILSLIILLCLSAFFSAAETALTAANKIRIKTLADDGDKRANCLMQIYRQKDKMLSAVLIGNNIVNLSASALVTAMAIRFFGNKVVGLATGILTLLVLVFGEIAPKTKALINAEKIALRDAFVIRALMYVLTPVIFIVNSLSRLFVRLTGTDPDAKPQSMTEDEFLTLVDEGHKDGVIESNERQMIGNVIDFGDAKAIDIMIPWIDVTSAETDLTYDELIEIFKESRYTRIPICEGSSDNVIGILNFKDLLLVDRDDFNLQETLHPAHFTFEQKKLSGLLSEMRENSLSIVVVIDEYGATSGIITLENVLEEIVGEITDEYKGRDAIEIITIEEGREFSVIGSVSLDDLNEATGLELESDEYETIGGYMIEHSEDKLPQVGESVELEDATLIVEAVGKNRIQRVHVYLKKD